jgi:hypothetical protein
MFYLGSDYCSIPDLGGKKAGLWIRIQRLCGSRSILGIRIQGQRKFSGKNALFSYLKKKLPLKSYKIALTTFKKN